MSLLMATLQIGPHDAGTKVERMENNDLACTSTKNRLLVLETQSNQRGHQNEGVPENGCRIPNFEKQGAIILHVPFRLLKYSNARMT